VFLSSFVSSLSSLKEKEKDRRKETHNLVGYQGDRLLCVACECCLWISSLSLSERKKKRRNKKNTTQTNTAARRQHLTLQQKSSCVCTCTVQRELITLSSRSLHGVGGKAAESGN